MWFSIADVQGQNGIAITTANGSGDLSLSYAASGWPNAGIPANLHTSLITLHDLS